jgi:hypothetical protein
VVAGRVVVVVEALVEVRAGFLFAGARVVKICGALDAGDVLGSAVA